MKKYLGLFVLPFAISLISCDPTDDKQEALLQGEWNCVEVIRGNESGDGSGIRFNFTEDDYTYQSGSYMEEGQFWVENDKLFTEGPEVMKKQVDIEKLSEDSLVLGMNDRGTTMTMTFIKAQ